MWDHILHPTFHVCIDWRADLSAPSLLLPVLMIGEIENEGQNKACSVVKDAHIYTLVAFKTSLRLIIYFTGSVTIYSATKALVMILNRTVNTTPKPWSEYLPRCFSRSSIKILIQAFPEACLLFVVFIYTCTHITILSESTWECSRSLCICILLCTQCQICQPLVSNWQTTPLLPEGWAVDGRQR